MIIRSKYNLKDNQTVLKAEAREFSDALDIPYYKVSTWKPFRINKSFYNLARQLFVQDPGRSNRQYRRCIIL